MKLTAEELADVLKGTVEGDRLATATSFSKIEHGKPGSLCFYANPKYEQYVYTCKSSILLVNNDFVPKESVTPTMVRVENAYSALATLLDYVSAQRRKYRRHRGHFTHIPCSTKIGHKVSIGDNCSVGRKCRIGDLTMIGDNVSIGEGTVIGSRCRIDSGVRIYPGMEIGDNVIIHSNTVIGNDGFGNAPQTDGTWKKIEHLGKVIIEDNVEIGANCVVARAEMEATIIGKGVKIDALCMIAHNVSIGENTVMAAQTGIAGSTRIGKSCILAGQVGIVGHITIADHTTIGAKSGIMSNIRKEGETWFGYPALLHKHYLRSFVRFKQSGLE